MTEVFYREYHDRTVLTVEGHSGFGKRGSDVVCAGVSTLVCTLLNCLKDEESGGRLKLHREIVRDGYVSVEIEHFSFAAERTRAIVDAMVSGLYMLAEEYPENVRVE